MGLRIVGAMRTFGCPSTNITWPGACKGMWASADLAQHASLPSGSTATPTVRSHVALVFGAPSHARVALAHQGITSMGASESRFLGIADEVLRELSRICVPVALHQDGLGLSSRKRSLHAQRVVRLACLLRGFVERAGFPK